MPITAGSPTASWLAATSRRARPRRRSHQRRARRCRLQRRRLATMGTGANYSFMDGWQASEAWRANLRAEYTSARVGGTNDERPLRSRRCQNGATLYTLSPGMLTTRLLFPKFFPKKFGQKIGAGPPMEDFGNGTCAGPVLLHPAPLSCR